MEVKQGPGPDDGLQLYNKAENVTSEHQKWRIFDTNDLCHLISSSLMFCYSHLPSPLTFTESSGTTKVMFYGALKLKDRRVDSRQMDSNMQKVRQVQETR